MSKDASEFSLEKEGNKIRPQIVNLSFRRLSDYAGNMNLKDTVHGDTYSLELWERFTKVPFSIKPEWKAYAVPLARRIILPQFTPHPKRIEYDRLIVLCPHNDSVLWAFQELKFVPKRGLSTCLQGSSEIWSVDDQNLTAIVRPGSDFWEIVHEELLNWMADTIEAKEKVTESLKRFHKECVGQWPKSVSQTAGLRKEPLEKRS